MTYVLFEEAGKICHGRLMSDADASIQVELDSGKRSKVKSAHVLLRFDKPEPSALLASAALLAAEIDLALAWEFAALDEFGFAEVARDYFSEQATLAEQTAMLLALHGAPHYFRRGGQKGRFKKAGAEVLAQALAAIEKKKQVCAQIDAWALALAQGTCPAPILEQLYKILFKPDKNAPEYKAVVQAARSTQTPPLVMLQKAGAIHNPYQFHWQRFLFEVFPQGLGKALSASASGKTDVNALPLAQVQAFSIDDSATTEIDDALSVQGLGSGEVLLGIHIAAPALGIQAGDALDVRARDRMSTIYMPGHKITMLPDAVVEPYTLQAGQNKPAVSLYVRFCESDFALRGFETKIERVSIAANLRYDQIDHIVTSDWLSNAALVVPGTPSDVQTLRPELSWLHALAQTLKAQRETVRGKPETFNRPDYSFKLDKADAQAENVAIVGDEPVSITPRVRGAPLDLIVAECMIVANSTWGGWLASLGVPAIYRSQASLGFGVKVRMGTKALPHAGIGVSAYAWSTSPLRRYTDLLNQWQIIAAAKHGATAALAAPFKPKDAALFAVISSFEAAYASYNLLQNTMERYWTLKYIAQNAITELDAVVMKDGMVRADSLPLVFPVLGAQELPRGSRIRASLGSIDFIALEVRGTLLLRLDSPGQIPSTSSDAVDDEDEAPVGALHIALDMDEVSTNEDNLDLSPKQNAVNQDVVQP